MSDLWQSVLGWFIAILEFLHGVLEPVFGVNAWGWAIVALTLIVRILLLPLAIKQTRSMRAMQAIQPEMKALQKKYKVDRELMKKDPEQYRAKKAKLNEEMMALYRERGANPAASCLPLLAQAPIFIALFWTLRQMGEAGEGLYGEPFYFFTAFGPEEVTPGLHMLVTQAGWPGWLLILLMSGSMYWTQRQMMARTALTQGGENPMAQQQKIMLYAMPIFLAVISFQFPLGILLYWVTTNVWQVAQQAIILREVKSEQQPPQVDDTAGGPSRRSPGASSGTKPVAKDRDKGDRDKGGKGDKGDKDRKAGHGSKDADAKGNGRPGDAGSSSGKDKGGTKRSDGSPATPPKKQNEDRSDSGSSNGQPKGGGTSSNGSGGSARRSKRDHLPRRPRS